MTIIKKKNNLLIKKERELFLPLLRFANEYCLISIDIPDV